MKPKTINFKKLRSIFSTYPEIKLVYFFGSKAKDGEDLLSDYDFAFYLKEKEVIKMYDLKFKLADEMSRALGTDKIDIVILNLVESPEMKYNIIKDGRLIYEKEPYKVLVEPKILNEYFDFQAILLRYNLTAKTR